MTREEAERVTGALFEEWAPTVVRYATHLTGSRETSEDAVQEAFLALYKELRSDRRIENPKGWTLRAVRNQLSKQWRRERRPVISLDPEQLHELADVRENGAEEPPEWEAVAPLLSTLTDREEEVILLRVQAMKYREIAAELDISSKSVATLLARALKKLRDGMKNRSLAPGGR